MAGKGRKLDMTEMDKPLVFPERSGGAGGMWFKWPDYEKWHSIRFLPAWDDAKLPYTPHCLHYRQTGSQRGAWPGLDGTGKDRAITCTEYKAHPPHIPVEPCPVCDLIAYCNKRGQEAKGFHAQVQWLTNVIVDNQVKVWSGTPLTIIKKLRDLTKNSRFGPDIFDPVLGRDMDIIRHGNKNDLGSIGYEMVHTDPSEIVLPGWEEKVKTLSTFIQHFDRQTVIKVLEAQMGDFLPVKECFREKKPADTK